MPVQHQSPQLTIADAIFAIPVDCSNNNVILKVAMLEQIHMKLDITKNLHQTSIICNRAPNRVFLQKREIINIQSFKCFLLNILLFVKLVSAGIL